MHFVYIVITKVRVNDFRKVTPLFVVSFDCIALFYISYKCFLERSKKCNESLNCIRQNTLCNILVVLCTREWNFRCLNIWIMILKKKN